MTPGPTEAGDAADIISTLLAKIASGELDATPEQVAQLEGSVMALRALADRPARPT
jgi:hypothetical protein